MNCWEILGLEPTTDKKSIKRAYAILLKSNKPDENPQGFVQLHAAYKESLHYAETVDNEAEVIPARQSLRESPQQQRPNLNTSSETYQLPSDTLDTSHKQEHTIETITIKPEEVEQAPPHKSDSERIVINADIDSHESNQEHIDSGKRDTAIIAADIADDNETLNEKQQRIAALKSVWQCLENEAGIALEKLQKNDDSQDWAFIENYDELYDIEFKQEFSYALFEQLLLFFEESQIATKKRTHVLQYLNNYFHWSEQSSHLAYHYGEERSDSIINTIAQTEYSEEKKLQWVTDRHHKGPIEHAGYYARIIAVAIDILCIYMVFGSSIFAAIVPQSSGNELLYSLLFYMIAIPIAEASPLQGSLGKILLGIKVTTKNGRRLSIFHSMWRQLMFLASTAGFKLTIWINIFTYDGRLLHDRFSYSIAIKR